MEARHQTFRIQREEEDAWLSVLDNVRAYIKFSKSGDTGDRWKSTWSYVLHDERNHANVGFTFEEIDFQAIWKVRLESISIDLPMHEGQFTPFLRDGMWTNRHRKRKMSVLTLCAHALPRACSCLNIIDGFLLHVEG